VAVAVALSLGGCHLGPKALEHSHREYNEAVKLVADEQLLLNLVRARYNDTLSRLDVSAIAAQYELDTSVEARPFFATEAANNMIGTFSRVLPFGGAAWRNRPTISLTPLDDPETLRGLFTPATLDGIIFLSETSWPVATVFRLWVEHLNRLPNAVTASGPPRGLVPEFQEFLRATELLQILQDRGDIRFIREERITELSSPLPEANVPATAVVEAAKSGYEYRQQPDRRWVLIRRDRRLDLKISPAAVRSPEVLELCQLLRLQPGRLSYPVTVGGLEEPFASTHAAEESTTLNIYPRSTVQAYFYASHGVLVPPEHLARGIVAPTFEADGTVFDWQQVTAGLFTVHSCQQHHRPPHAYVAVKYQDYWFYIDDRDNASKVSFALIAVMTRVNLLGVRKGGPALTLPVGR
jgi:hypothetical protein